MADHVELLESVLYRTAKRSGDGTLEERDDWVQLTTPQASSEFRNGILRCVVDESEADARIDAAIAHYGTLNVPFRWFVTPSTRPLDLAERLEAKGFVQDPVLLAMVANPAAFPRPTDDSIRIEWIDASGIETWLQCQVEGWGMPPPAIERFRKELTRRLAAEPQTSEYCVAYKNGVPSGSASMTHFDGFTHFNGAEVAPRARRQGIYRALCLERMRVLRARGVTLVTNHCRQDTSAPICTRMGFDTICAFKVYVFGKA